MRAESATATVQQLKKLYNPRLTIGGILITMYNGRLNLTGQVIDELIKYYPDKLFKTYIGRNVRLSEAPSYGMPAMYYDSSSSGAIAYRELCAEFMERIPAPGFEVTRVPLLAPTEIKSKI